MATELLSAFLLICLVLLSSVMFDGCLVLFIQVWASQDSGCLHSSSFRVRFVLATRGSSTICFSVVWNSLTCESPQTLEDSLFIVRFTLEPSGFTSICSSAEDVTWLWDEISCESLETFAELKWLEFRSPNEEFFFDLSLRHPRMIFGRFTPETLGSLLASSSSEDVTLLWFATALESVQNLTVFGWCKDASAEHGFFLGFSSLHSFLFSACFTLGSSTEDVPWFWVGTGSESTQILAGPAWIERTTLVTFSSSGGLTRGKTRTRLVRIKFSLTGRVGAGVSTLATENRNGVSLSFTFFSVLLLPRDALLAESALERRVDGCFTSLFALPSLNNLNCVSVRLTTAGEVFHCFLPASECREELHSFGLVFGGTLTSTG